MVERYLYDVFEGLNEGVIIIDKLHKVVFVNSALEKIQSINREAVLSKDLLQVYPTLTYDTSNLINALNKNKIILRKKTKYINYKGEELITINSSYPIMCKKKIVGALGIVLNEKYDVRDNTSKIKLKNIVMKKKNSNIRYDFINILGKSKPILNLKKKALKIACSSSPVLIYGETGTGKELFVQSIHNNSFRKKGPFIVQNCAAIPEELFESTMFGTTNGSFTGAKAAKGLFELANGGTLYLDEINSMPIKFQGKLLRVIQDGCIRRIGDNNTKHVDVRIIASLNESPEYILQNRRFRRDLYYRLNVLRLNIPPLRKRREDIPVLISYFIKKFNNEFSNCIEGIDEDALSKLVNYEWKGNVRELEHTLESIFNFKQEGFITLQDLKCYTDVCIETLSLKEKLMSIENQYIKNELETNNFNISKTAKNLGIPRQTLQYKIKKFNIIE
ncbi:sigma-54 interaction domain-containing protein [Haloimpatiens sp. FM7330]|uniref:sigma-54 interaction domain-containing protein n=1 Tax=Haloimpatiens sp. FM7330 TaxID=3298610 RepID=UPI0036380467